MGECVHGWDEQDYGMHCHDCREEAGLVACDSKECEAKLFPTTLKDAAVAIEHWKHHRYLGGCAHGR